MLSKIWLVLAAGLLCCGVVQADDRIQVVTTQTIFADIVRQIGGDRVEVSAIASPKHNVHFYQPKPTDVRKVRNADLYVHNGLGLEAWSEPLLEAAGKPELFQNGSRNVDVSQGVKLLDVPDRLSRADGDIHGQGNPHVHMNPDNARIFVANILQKLQELDPANADHYKERADAFLVELDRKISEWHAMCAHLKGKEIISYHEDIAYFAEFLGLVSKEFIEPKPGIPPTAKHLQFLEKYAQDHHVRGILMPTYYSKISAQELARRVGGELIVIAQGVGELPGTDDFFSFFDYNFKQMSEGVQ